jgi:signal transduction histidine kinase
MHPLIGKLKWLGIVVPVLYIGLVELLCPLLHPAGPENIRTHLWLIGLVALGAGAFCFIFCRTISSRSEVDCQAMLLQEQQRLARDLHDDLAQLVASLHLAMAAWERELDSMKEPGLKRRVKELRLTTENIYDKVRAMICGRHCEGVPREGFFVALRACAQEFMARTGMPIRVELPPENATPIPAPVTTQLLRIIREALCNIHRHSGARQAMITAQIQDNDLNVTVADNGRGFDPQRVLSASGFGLQIMRERAEQVNGWLSVTTAPGEGTRITVRVPIVQEKPKWKDRLESWSPTTILSSAEG